MPFAFGNKSDELTIWGSTAHHAIKQTHINRTRDVFLVKRNMGVLINQVLALLARPGRHWS